MIGWVRGPVVTRDAAGPTVVVNVGGVGYELTVSLQTFAELPPDGDEVELWVHTHVRQEAFSLFGFGTRRERAVFLQLLSVPKVGPKNAVAVIGGFPLDDLVSAIAGGDAKSLVKIPGIGKRTAEQIVLSIGDKVLAHASPDGADSTSSPAPPELEGDEATRQAQETLVAWGWKAKQAEGALAKVQKTAGAEQLTLEELLRRTMVVLTQDR